VRGRLALLGLAAALAASASAGSREDEAAAAVRGFYARYVELRPAGLPTREQQKSLAPFLSRRLLALMDGARTYSEARQKAHPDEKPPFVDGCLFASLFEGPKTFDIGAVAAEGSAFRVQVHFRYDDQVAWDDSVLVVREGKRSVIDDVLLSGAGEFNPPGRLTEALGSREP
jgi:hypothetical protein